MSLKAGKACIEDAVLYTLPLTFSNPRGERLIMTDRTWAKALRLAPLSFILTALTLGGISSVALAAEDAARGPIQDFNWLKDARLLDQALEGASTKDDDDDDNDDDDDDDDNDGGQVIYQRTTTTTTVTQTQFTDISTATWASDFIYRLSAIQVVSGFPGGVFLPTNSLTKSQYAAMIARAFDQPTIRQTTTIRNLSSNYWAYQSIQKAYAMGFLDLDDATLNPDATMTRLDMLVMLARGMGITQVSEGRSVDAILSVFSDANQIPSEYRVIIAALVERGVLVNYPTVTTLNLFSTVSRAEACSFVYQAMAYLGKIETVESAYIVNATNITGLTGLTMTTTTTTTETNTMTVGDDDDDDDDDDRQNCNQGIGNGAEGCDPGRSQPHGGSNDEGGRTPGNR